MHFPADLYPVQPLTFHRPCNINIMVSLQQKSARPSSRQSYEKYMVELLSAIDTLITPSELWFYHLHQAAITTQLH